MNDESTRLDLDQFEKLAAAGEINTVVCATPDPYGRLVGKRLTVPAFRSLGLSGAGINASSFIFAVDLEMNPLDLPVSNAANGWADIRLIPDLTTLRRVPWEPNVALVICDAYESHSDTMLSVAPRTILRRQIERARQQGLTFKFASELEFFLSATPPRQAWELGYQDLKMLSDYRSDYQMIQSSRDDWFIERIRNQMPGFGVSIESSKPEWGLGQQEVTLDYCDTLEMADRHVLFKYGVKQLAHAADLTVTFMAKPKIDDVGSSCHLHVSMWSTDGEPLSWSTEPGGGMSATFGSFVAGQLTHATDIALLFAPTVNSYKRFQPDQFAGTAIALGNDNRSCAFRLVGGGPSFRVENRIPGGDVNPYYAYSATIAAGLAGIEHELPAPGIFDGNAWNGQDVPIVPTSMHEALRLFAECKMARTAFGDEVFDHLLASSQSELVAFDSHTVTDWEKCRYYERV
ncbi:MULTISPECIES: glutamine synthetase family protein [Mycolicibacterium]|uniref:Glutamate--ammonia ligase n=1 Tax=Mycolicibacterium vanbaalenii (strain DSM 7251 / JCM 13017 / BCRC 16820 / KCTC 9966 / NRRL B-24157 / PYR-1) TaxID=350058 RepID=A1T2Q1_MYCVP|nr:MULTISPECIES: glutamine synthetase family protein [Mycolicibacterium]ABM11451.1 Glutamate--ammonia ligase [Mycolicibacterium vanbaalenii PYR-1]MCV7127801.1 glutamine synthetase [Mycolicibacterium vanbaalenii PYR-1]PQP44896.1 glutamine synthetase [Mycolicibacterium austroafricanum]UJL29623.1 glutamine synthetase [Mycolicibacterium vanbaalenii]WND57332.1 glutamine synthetase family protein [Mycolicibacterium vanbaalenii]